MATARYSDFVLYRRVLGHLRPYWLHLSGILLLSLLSPPLKTMSKKMGVVQSQLAGAERAFALLDESPDETERPNARPLSRAKGAVAFRNASFAYERGRRLLSNVSFEIRSGTRVGIVGTTGAGKTTLVNLLPGFYDPREGQILLD